MDRYLSTGKSASRAPAPRSQEGTSPLYQTTIGQMAGVVNWRDEAATSAAPELQSIPSTLYLGQGDVETLRDLLSDAIKRDDAEAALAVMRRLSALPCTRDLLETTRVGVVVGKLRKHADAQIKELAGRLVRVWKAQLKEHKAQRRLAKLKGVAKPDVNSIQKRARS